MSYRLDSAVPMSEALRRVAFAELELAHGALHAPPERHSGVHSARKCLKRLRSLLLLARPGMPEPAFATLTNRLAAIAKGLAAARDAAALIDAIDKLEKETGPGPGLGPLQSLRAWLHKRRHAAEQNLEKSAASDTMRGLLEVRPAFAGLAVYPDDFRSLAKGLRRCYRSTREAFSHAFAAEHDEDLHEWRKGVQHHWRQMQLLAPCWPSELSARAEAARSLSQLLGDDHDISLLIRLVSTPTMMFGTPDETAAFLKRCRRRHKALRKAASTQGERLFAERARPFAERIETYWQIAAGDAAKSRDEARPDNVVAFGELRTPRAGSN
ncbi:MAG TPA: CHAD domain-containing protein [Methyloceanibacter sp.]|nr:CHAD domain-containing protein [Methyloceanibacter sp.]